MTQVPNKITQLSYNCGIDARNLTPAQIREEHNKMRDPLYSDQHDALLDEALTRMGV